FKIQRPDMKTNEGRDRYLEIMTELEQRADQVATEQKQKVPDISRINDIDIHNIRATLESANDDEFTQVGKNLLENSDDLIALIDNDPGLRASFAIYTLVDTDNKDLSEYVARTFLTSSAGRNAFRKILEAYEITYPQHTTTNPLQERGGT